MVVLSVVSLFVVVGATHPADNAYCISSNRSPPASIRTIVSDPPASIRDPACIRTTDDAMHHSATGMCN